MGNSADRAWQPHSSWKGSRLLSTPATAACLTCRPDIVCPNRLGGMMQPAKAAHCAFPARRKLATSGLRARRALSQPAVLSALLVIRLFGSVFHLRISPKSTKGALRIFGLAQRSFITFHGALWNILLSAGFPAMFHMISARTNVCQWLFAEIFSLTAAVSNRIDSIRNLYIFFCVEFSNVGKSNFGKNELPYSAILPFVPCLILIFKPVRIILIEIFWIIVFRQISLQTVRAVVRAAGLCVHFASFVYDLRWGAWFGCEEKESG